MVLCEVCGEKEYEVDGLVDGEYKKMCRQCANFEGAIVVQKPSDQTVQDSMYRRPKVRQVLSRMAGITKDNYTPETLKPVKNPYAGLRIPAARKNVSLDDLREVKQAHENEEKALNAEVSQIEDVEAEVEQHKEKVSWFKKLFRWKVKEEYKEAEPHESVPGPAADSAVEAERVNRVRIVDSK